MSKVKEFLCNVDRALTPRERQLICDCLQAEKQRIEQGPYRMDNQERVTEIDQLYYKINQGV